MKSITIVTHCWCPPGQDIYAQMLKHQWSSILHAPDGVHARLVVCASSEDGCTGNVFLRCKELQDHVRSDARQIQLYALPQSKLFRRAIGRNLVARAVSSDVVWFTDVDILFGAGSLSAACELVSPDDGLCMPERMHISYDEDGEFPLAERPHHELGHRYVEDRCDNPFPEIDPSCFRGTWKGPCIGSVQIVGGNMARKYGYLDGTSWVEPVDPRNGFRSCKCDVKFRRYIKEKTGAAIRKLPIPNVYRIRHVNDGRDYDAQGHLVGRIAW
jgi:hypothetical protein